MDNGYYRWLAVTLQVTCVRSSSYGIIGKEERRSTIQISTVGPIIILSSSIQSTYAALHTYYTFCWILHVGNISTPIPTTNNDTDYIGRYRIKKSKCHRRNLL